MGRLQRGMGPVLTNRERSIMELALAIAESTPTFGQARVGAVIAIKYKIISVGFNASKKHPFATKYQRHEKAIYPHAEVSTIYGASKKLSLEDFSKVTLYVGRIKKDIHGKDTTGLAKPCSACDQAIKAFGINKIIYSTDIENEYRTIQL